MPLDSPHNRCNFPGCDHPDDEDLFTCEACGGKTCKSHSGGCQLCHGCDEVQYEAAKVAAAALKSLAARMLAVRISACDAAAESLSIMDELERWDLGIERMAERKAA